MHVLTHLIAEDHTSIHGMHLGHPVQTDHLVLIVSVANRRDAAHSVGSALDGALAHGTRVPAAPTLRALDHAR